MFATNQERNGISGIPVYIGEFWTAKQRQASSLQEISYRACFKPQLPRYFIERLTAAGQIVYDPFMGRGTTVIEAALLGRNVIGNDINPLSTVLTRPRLMIPSLEEIMRRLDHIPFSLTTKADIDLSMFFSQKTEAEIVCLQRYLKRRKISKKEDDVDRWIRMVATNRLTGHSPGFFSVYTLPPNQAASRERQIKINARLRQKPAYRDVKKIILKKSKDLLKNLTDEQRTIIAFIAPQARLLATDARRTHAIADTSVHLTVTSPPFLNTVQYRNDNWLRCWFNCIDDRSVAKVSTMESSLPKWCEVMKDVFTELYRITVPGGHVAFEVGEIRKGSVKLEEYVIPLGDGAGFNCKEIYINRQHFTKTANIWGIGNNSAGTNSNRIVLFQK